MIGNLKLIPTKIYRLGSLSIFVSIHDHSAVYGVAMIMQVFTVLMGFAEKSQINVWLTHLQSKLSCFVFFFGAVFLQEVGLFTQSFINIAFAETFNYEVRRRFLEALFRSGASWKHDLGSTSNIMMEVIPKSANFVTSIARF